MTPIIIPLHPSGGKFRNNTELRFALRSIEQHFQTPYKIVIVSKKLPDWLKGVEHLYGEGLKSSLVVAAQAYPDGFFWFYDDCCLLRDTTAQEMMQTPACKSWGKAQTGWGRRLEEIRLRLKKEGWGSWDYSRPHGPYWFDKAMVEEGFADWPGMKSKFPWESWILSKRDWPRRHGVVKQYYGPFRGAPRESAYFLNYNDRGNSVELRAWLQNRFSKPSAFEQQSKPAGKIEVHTIRFGAPWWLDLCAKTLDSWCLTHGHDLKIWGQSNINPEYPSPKFCEVDMLRDFLQGGAEWLLYVDSDVYVAADAPASPEQSPGFWIREDLPGSGPRDFRRWCRRHLGARKREAAKWDYRNAGVWFCDRTSAASLLQVISEPYIEGCMEQHHFNWWLCQAASAGLHVGFLGREWNGWAYEDEAAAFSHIAGKRKATRLKMFREKGFIPGEPFQAAFDMHKYPIPENRDQSMDDRHIHALHLEACSDWEGSRVAVEIGSYKGHSTTALVEALRLGKLDHLHVIETAPTEELRAVLALAPADKITLHTVPSWEVPIVKADFVFIDGDHRWPAMLDTLKALSWGAKTICMHDSAAWPKLAHCWGSWNAARALKGFSDREWTEDAKSRPGEHTYRGFLVSKAR